jgi:hypothetical protein
MKRNALLILSGLLLVLGSCAVVQSVVRSTFPFTVALKIPRSAQVGVELEATGTATSMDQNFSKNPGNSDRVKEVRVTSARLDSHDPSDFNIGNLVLVKIYLTKADGSGEVLVASRTDITAGVGNSLVLDIDNGKVLDEYIHAPTLKVRLVYKLHNHVNQNINLRLTLGVSANRGN